MRERLDSCFQTKEEYNKLQEEYDNLTTAQRSSLSKEERAKFKIKIGEIKLWEITEEHISSAQALIKIGRYQEPAIRVLTEALLLTGEGGKDIRKLASEALSECGSEIAMFDASSRDETSSLDKIELTCGKCKNGKRCCSNGKCYSC